MTNFHCWVCSTFAYPRFVYFLVILYILAHFGAISGVHFHPVQSPKSVNFNTVMCLFFTHRSSMVWKYTAIYSLQNFCIPRDGTLYILWHFGSAVALRKQCGYR